MSRGKLNVLALMDQVLVPPDDPGDANLETVEWKTEYHVVQALRARHRPGPGSAP